MLTSINLKTRTVLWTAGILILVLVFNALVNIPTATGKYRAALIARTTALAGGIRKDINKAIGLGLPLNALEGMGDRLRGLMDEDKDLSGVMIMDAAGKVLYAGDRAQENTVPGDEWSKKALDATEPKVQHYSDSTGGP